MKSVRRWLASIIILILLMIGVGGVTRLTGSGLSITEWKPILGAIPPLSDAEWNLAFQKYQAIPQFNRINSGMDLAGFKWIFFWEYMHRLLGRLIGLAFALPLIVFLVKRRVPSRWVPHLILAFVLGGLQGFLGWFMVKSGLAELTYVSHYRLAAHFLLALLIAGYLLWIRNRMADEESGRVRPYVPGVARVAPWIALGILVQTFYGALTAGLKAGYQFPTFPTLGGEWLPASLWARSPGWRNLMDNPVTVQWVHRLLGTLLVLGLFVLWWKYRRNLPVRRQRRALATAAHLALVQYVAGIGLVLNGIPVWLGTFHQVIGSLVFLASVNLLYEFPCNSQPGLVFLRGGDY